VEFHVKSVLTVSNKELVMLKKLTLTAAALAASIGIAIAGGAFNGFPIVGDPGNDVCLSFGNNGVCNQFSPAGPSTIPNGAIIPADTGNPSGQNPQTVLIPSGILGTATNRIIGGDMSVNLAQRLSTAKGVTALATLSPTAAVMTADRWWVIAPAAGVTVTIDSTASTAVIPGQNNTKALRIARTTSGAAGIVCVGQTLDKSAAAPLIGNNAIFSFYEFNGSTQSATNGNITVNIDYSSAADTAGTQATLGFAGGNGSLFALGDVGLLSAGPTNMTRGVSGFSAGTTGTLASGVATITASTTWTRYSVYANIPTNIPSTTTPVTNVSVSICWTPTATTAVTTDYIELNFMQLEAKSSQVTLNTPNGVTAPSVIARSLAAVEALYQYSYLYFVYENQSLVTPVPFTSCTTTTSTTAAVCNISFPVPMRIAPAMQYTNGFQLFTSTAYTTLGAAAGLATYSNTLVTVPGNTGVMMTATASVLPAVGTANFLMQLGTSSATGIISASAEP
jgi:hypothetical protein